MFSRVQLIPNMGCRAIAHYLMYDGISFLVLHAEHCPRPVESLRVKVLDLVHGL
jgi:hypothetical protein